MKNYMQKIDAEALRSMRALVDYLHDDEQKSFEEIDGIAEDADEVMQKHIFSDVVRVAAFLDNYKHEEPQAFPRVRIENMTGRTGREVANQFIIHTDAGQFFQSYASVIAFRPVGGGAIVLDEGKWDYSTTTGKYRNEFLGESKPETEKKIRSGAYVLANLNG